MKFRVWYRRARVTVDAVKPRMCLACKRPGRTELHHYFYAHPTSRVKSTPLLALDNTVPLCYQCHKIADMFKKMSQDAQRTVLVHNVIAPKIRGVLNVEKT